MAARHRRARQAARHRVATRRVARAGRAPRPNSHAGRVTRRPPHTRVETPDHFCCSALRSSGATTESVAYEPHACSGTIHMTSNSMPSGSCADDVISEALGGPVIVAFSLIVFGAVLWWADRRSGARSATDLGVRDAWLIGAAQVLALNPGTSRSGITISAMRALGFARTEAVQMSFVIGVPIIAGAGVWKTVGLIVDGLPDGLGQAMVIGITAAAVTGWLAINALQRLAARSNFNAFVVYRVVLALVVLNLALTGLR
ncbi:MAG: undecaprenyl-diphosphate phosphatase [Actinobacteria bacterium]|nr:undecaprenyl-diphosphate phosphatase [Actinomycetota bacterium]